MKVNIKGDEIECSVQEYLELSRLRQGSDVSKTVLKTKIEPIVNSETRQVRRYVKRNDMITEPIIKVFKSINFQKFTETEERFILKHRKHGYSYLQKCFPNRTKSSIQNRYSILNVREKKSRNINNQTKKNMSKNTQRLKFVHERAKHYQQTLGISNNEAMKKGFADYREQLLKNKNK